MIGSLDRPKTSAAESEGRLLKSFGIGRLCLASVIACARHCDLLEIGNQEDFVFYVIFLFQ